MDWKTPRILEVQVGMEITTMADWHKSIDTLRAYVRNAELFKDHAGTGLLWASATEARAPGTTCVSPW
jgi:coenzyme PQQ precursor peptide PqqA